MSEDLTITASISCLCGKVSAQQIPLESFIKSFNKTFNKIPLCHCSACRATSGVLCTSYYSLLTPDPTTPPHSESHYDHQQQPLLVSNPYLREYVQSTRLSRWFCGICGAHVLAQLKPENRYLIAAGLIVPAESSASESECVAVHYGIGETVDGGLSVFMPGSVDVGSSTACLIDSASVVNTSIPPSEPNVGQKADDNTDKHSLQAQCHCGGTNFTVTRPNDQSKESWSPWPDVIIPYHSGSPKNSEDVKWWLRANDTKYFAGTCACNSCRLASGFPIQCWAFIPKANLVVGRGDGTFTYETGTMKRFESSPGVYREFCSVCGATAFWHCDERPGVVDVSVGLLRSVAGARAEDWLEWATGRVSFAENALDKGLIDLLDKGLKTSVN